MSSSNSNHQPSADALYCTSLQQAFSSSSSSSSSPSDPSSPSSPLPPLSIPSSSTMYHHHHSNDSTSSTSSSSFCPLAHCTIKEASLIEHLVQVHQAQVCNVEPNEDNKAALEVDTPVVMGQGRLRRSVLIIECYNHKFLWSLEARARADGEEQVSIVIRPLDEMIRAYEDKLCSSPASSCSSPSASSPSSATSHRSLHSRQSSFSSLSTTAHGEQTNLSAHKDSSSNEDDFDLFFTRRLSPSSKSFFNVSLTVLAAHPESPHHSWKALIDANAARTWPERQEHLVSRGDALVLLYPTHAQAFKMVSSKQGVVTIRTEIEKC